MAKQSAAVVGLKILVWLLLIAGVAGGGYYYYNQEPIYDVTTLTIDVGPVESTVAAISSGAVMPEARAMVAAGAMGVIDIVHVEEGQRVEAGDLLVELQHEELDAQVAMAKANLEVGRSRVAQARLALDIGKEVSQSRLSQAAAQRSTAESDFKRVRSLFEQEAISKSELEKIDLALRLAREAEATASAGKKEDLVRGEDIRSAEALLGQLEAAVQAAEAARERCFVRAPIKGVVGKINLRKGEATAMGVPLLQLVDDSARYIEAPFDEANAAQISVGEMARIELDAYPEQEFLGEVTYVSPVVTPNMDLSRTLTVKVKILTEPEKFVIGMSADVTLVVERRENILRLPTESLVREEYCYVVENGRAHRRDVTLGIGNWEFKEGLSGVKAGDVLITSISIKELADGVRVNPVEELGTK